MWEVSTITHVISVMVGGLSLPGLCYLICAHWYYLCCIVHSVIFFNRFLRLHWDLLIGSLVRSTSSYSFDVLGNSKMECSYFKSAFLKQITMQIDLCFIYKQTDCCAVACPNHVVAVTMALSQQCLAQTFTKRPPTRVGMAFVGSLLRHRPFSRELVHTWMKVDCTNLLDTRSHWELIHNNTQCLLTLMTNERAYPSDPSTTWKRISCSRRTILRCASMYVRHS